MNWYLTQEEIELGSINKDVSNMARGFKDMSLNLESSPIICVCDLLGQMARDNLMEAQEQVDCNRH